MSTRKKNVLFDDKAIWKTLLVLASFILMMVFPNTLLIVQQDADNESFGIMKQIIMGIVLDVIRILATALIVYLLM